MFGFGIHNGSDDVMQGADRGPTAWLTGYNSCDKSNPTEGGAAARVAAKEFAAPAKAYDTDSGGDKTEFGDLLANGVDVDQGVKKAFVQTGNSLAVCGRKMMLMFLFSMIGSVSADACSTPCASGTCASLKEYLSCSEFAELNCDCAGCCSMPPPSMPPPLQHHAPSAPPMKKTKVAAALLTAVAGKKLMDKVPDDLTCSESEVSMCEEIESLETENIELKLKVDVLESQDVEQGVMIAQLESKVTEQNATIAELKLEAELLANNVAALKRFVGMMPPAAPPPRSPPPSPPAAPPPDIEVSLFYMQQSSSGRYWTLDDALYVVLGSSASADSALLFRLDHLGRMVSMAGATSEQCVAVSTDMTSGGYRLVFKECNASEVVADATPSYTESFVQASGRLLIYAGASQNIGTPVVSYSMSNQGDVQLSNAEFVSLFVE